MAPWLRLRDMDGLQHRIFINRTFFENAEDGHHPYPSCKLSLLLPTENTACHGVLRMLACVAWRFKQFEDAKKARSRWEARVVFGSGVNSPSRLEIGLTSSRSSKKGPKVTSPLWVLGGMFCRHPYNL